MRALHNFVCVYNVCTFCTYKGVHPPSHVSTVAERSLEGVGQYPSFVFRQYHYRISVVKNILIPQPFSDHIIFFDTEFSSLNPCAENFDFQ